MPVFRRATWEHCSPIPDCIQTASRSHQDRIQTSLGLYRDRSQIVFRPYPDRIQAVSRPHPNHIQIPSRPDQISKKQYNSLIVAGAMANNCPMFGSRLSPLLYLFSRSSCPKKSRDLCCINIQQLLCSVLP